MAETSKPYHHGDLARTLVETASDIITESGMEQVSVREVAKRAQVSPGAPFRHFASRDALLAAVAGEAMTRLAKAAHDAQAAEDHDPLAQIEAIGQAYLAWAMENPEHFKVISLRRLVSLSPEATAQNAALRDRMIDLLDKAARDGSLRPDLDRDTALLSCRATVYGLARMQVDGHFPEWMPEGDPSGWMTRALAQFITSLRPITG